METSGRIRLQEVMWIALFGTAWGLNELLVGGAFYKAHPDGAPVWLIAFGVIMLAMARSVANRVGSSVVLGLIAALFKSVNTQPFVCHILGIVMLGLVFELVYDFLLLKHPLSRTRTGNPIRSKSPMRSGILIRLGIAGFSSVLLSNILFALLLAVILREEFWVANEYAKAYQYILVTGSLSAAVSAVTVPLAWKAGERLADWTGRFPAWAVGGAAAGTGIIWISGMLGAL